MSTPVSIETPFSSTSSELPPPPGIVTVATPRTSVTVTPAPTKFTVFVFTIGVPSSSTEIETPGGVTPFM